MGAAALAAILPLALAALDSTNKLLAALVESQTADQKKIMWDRHIAATQPLYNLIAKIEAIVTPETAQGAH